MIRRRHVFHIAGYDPADAERHFRRLARELETFKQTWNVDASVSAAVDAALPTRIIQARGLGWEVETTCEFWAWDDIVGEMARTPMAARLSRAAVTFFDLFASGTVFRYLRANVRYALFSLFPVVQVALFGIAGWIVAHWLVTLLGISGTVGVLTTAVVALGLFVLLLHWPGRRWRVQQALDDWIFARDYTLGRHSGMERRLDAFAGSLTARASDRTVDEIVIVGHSLGALFALEVVARALQRDPHFARNGPPLSIVTVGATIPKCALHPAAERIRENLRRVAGEPAIFWTEYQARDDAISFYKFDPLALKKIDADQLTGRPVIRRVQIHDMLKPATFKKHQWRFLRLHYQFVMANDRPAPYDYFMMICGPVPVREWAVAATGILEFMNVDGRARIPVPAGPQP